MNWGYSKRTLSPIGRIAAAAVLAAATVAARGVPAWAEGPNAILTLPTDTSTNGCRDNFLDANDDGSTGIIGLPFTLNFFGSSYGALFVNNNGNVTFDGALSTFTPFNLQSTSHVIIAPFFADIDTRGTGSGVVTYGATTFAGRPAFCVDWVDVGYFGGHTDKRNSAQLLLVDRSDIQAGDFDILFNYDKVEFETGDASGGSAGLGGSSARIGYSNGVNTSFELPGSAVNGAFLDSNLATGLVHSNQNSIQLGRYIFPVRNGEAPVGGTIAGGVFANSILPQNALAGSLVEVCGTDNRCRLTTTAANGQYAVSGLPADSYRVTAFPPPATDYVRGVHLGVMLADNEVITDEDIIVLGPTPPPNNAGITSRATNPAGIPILYWAEASTLTGLGCVGGGGFYEVHNQAGGLIQGGGMTEDPPGTYTAIVPPFYPNHGNAVVTIRITCPNSDVEEINFDIYIDPSGIVKDTNGAPIAGATLTLFRADASAGPFEQVPDGSAIMSPINRDNPDAADANGLFGWDVVAGFYKVRAEKAGCHAPGDAQQPFVETDVLTIPPPVTDLALVLDCGEESGCGNGVIDGNEQCDGSAGGLDAACCTESCELRPAGTSCDDDGNVCTTDACDAGGLCRHDPNDASCDDGDACTTGDHCVDSACVSGGPVECPACLECDSQAGCIVAPQQGCRKPRRSSLLISTRENGRLIWRWNTDDGVSRSDFGDPLSATDYTLCVYDAVDTAARLVLKASAPRDCGRRPCWLPSQNEGFHFGNPNDDVSGLRSIDLRADPNGSAHVGVRGRGENLQLAPLPLDPRVTVQLQASNGMCWDADYDSASRLTDDTFRARSAQGPTVR